jgi:hypothetical protein
MDASYGRWASAMTHKPKKPKPHGVKCKECENWKCACLEDCNRRTDENFAIINSLAHSLERANERIEEIVFVNDARFVRIAELSTELREANKALESYVASFDEYRRIIKY